MQGGISSMPPVPEVWPKLQEIGDECFPPILSLSQLPNRVEIDKLRPGILPRYAAVVADLEQVVGCFGKSGSLSLLCALEDGTFLCIHNAVISWESEKEELLKLLPRARVAITGGLFKNNVIYAPCMAAVVFLGLHEEDESTITSLEPLERAKVIRLRGNDRFSCGEYVLAGLFYNAAAEAAAGAQQQDELVLAYANHAQCMLRLGRYEEAISSCDKALGLDPLHSKSHFRRGKALSFLQSHREALASFTAALESSEQGKAPAIQKAIDEASKLAHQQETGAHDVLGFFLSGFRNAPSCSDFTSDAVEIRRTGDGKGRGLFLTRDAAIGELLLVSNPVASSVATAGETAFNVETIRACGRSRRARRILNSLPDSHEVRSLPDARCFAGYSTSNMSTGEDDEVIDVRRVKRAVFLAGFRVRVSDESMKIVFGLPGLVNHSCLPNSTTVMIGRALFIRAAKQLRAGEEITIGYIDCLRPLGYRSRMMRLCWGFRCRCERCVVEEKLKRALSGVPEPRCFKDGMGRVGAAAESFRRVEEALGKLAGGVSEAEKSMIRAGFIEAYGMVTLNMQLGICREACRRFNPMPGAEVMRLLHDFVPGYLKSIVLIARMELRLMAGLVSSDSGSGSGSGRRVQMFRDAMAALTGNGTLPVGDYINMCRFFNDDKNVYSLVDPLVT